MGVGLAGRLEEEESIGGGIVMRVGRGLLLGLLREVEGVGGRGFVFVDFLEAVFAHVVDRAH